MHMAGKTRASMLAGLTCSSWLWTTSRYFELLSSSLKFINHWLSHSLSLFKSISHIVFNLFLFFLIFKKFWLYHATCKILAPQPGIKPMLPALEVQSLNQWTSREVHIYPLSHPTILTSPFPCPHPQLSVLPPTTSWIVPFKSYAWSSNFWNLWMWPHLETVFAHIIKFNCGYSGSLECCSPWGPQSVRHDWVTEQQVWIRVTPKPMTGVLRGNSNRDTHETMPCDNEGRV